jgi:hypothetical protein
MNDKPSSARRDASEPSRPSRFSARSVVVQHLAGRDDVLTKGTTDLLTSVQTREPEKVSEGVRDLIEITSTSAILLANLKPYLRDRFYKLTDKDSRELSDFRTKFPQLQQELQAVQGQLGVRDAELRAARSQLAQSRIDIDYLKERVPIPARAVMVTLGSNVTVEGSTAAAAAAAAAITTARAPTVPNTSMAPQPARVPRLPLPTVVIKKRPRAEAASAEADPTAAAAPAAAAVAVARAPGERPAKRAALPPPPPRHPALAPSAYPTDDEEEVEALDYNEEYSD